MLTDEVRNAVREILSFEPENLDSYITEIVDRHAVSTDNQLKAKMDVYKVKYKKHDMIEEIKAVLLVRGM